MFHFRVIGVLKLSPYSFDKGRHFFLPSILLCIAQWLTLSAFEGIGMPAFDSVKRVTPVIIFCASSAISRQSRLNNAQLVGVIGVSLGSLLTVNLELSLDRYSLFYGLTAATLQAVAYMQFEILSRTYQDEIRDAFMFMLTSAHPWFGGVFAVLLLSGILIQFVTFLCLEHNGALRTQILSNIRAAVQIFIAYFLSLYLFYDVSPSFLNYISLICTIGAAYYLYKQRSADCMPQKSPLTNKV
uniref:TPT domain-containing protein n=1 Tax=Angiostrongylus cantonensis TaxID=6313 RepID=A0A0K0DQQ0_ANGCA